MEITDYILVNMLKTQLVDLYRTYTENPSLIDNTPSRWGYDLLVKANTVNDFKHWLRRASISDFSYTIVDGIRSRENLLAEFVDLVMEANDSTVAEFIEWKKNVTPDKVDQTDERNAKAVSKVLAALEKPCDAHVVLFECSGKWAAIGADAERLFQLFGWQTGYVVSEECVHVPFMYVNKYGLAVLNNSPYVVDFVDLVEVGTVDIVSESFLEDETSCAQQVLDYLRIVETDIAKMSKFMRKDFKILARCGSHPRLLGLLNLEILKNKITTRLDTGERFTIADGSSWRLDEWGLPIVFGLSKKLSED